MRIYISGWTHSVSEGEARTWIAHVTHANMRDMCTFRALLISVPLCNVSDQLDTSLIFANRWNVTLALTGCDVEIRWQNVSVGHAVVPLFKPLIIAPPYGIVSSQPVPVVIEWSWTFVAAVRSDTNTHTDHACNTTQACTSAMGYQSASLNVAQHCLGC